MKSAFIRLFALNVAIVALFAPSAPAREVALVEDGVALAPIVVFDNAPPRTRRAAGELAEYIEKTSGARPEVIEGLPDPIPEPAIWVGYQPILDEVFPGLDFDFQHPEEMLIAASGQHLVIAGRDRWQGVQVAATGQAGRETVVRQQEYGTANAVYTFLQEHLGVRWLWPGELGEDVLEQSTIAFEPFEHRFHPPFRQRGVFRLGRAFEWRRLQRNELGSLQTPVGHAFSNWWDKYHEEHPEYFALQPDGTRSGWPSPRTAKLCETNPGVWAQWLANVEESLREDPLQTVFNTAANDSSNRGICICESCLAWDHPDARPWRMGWQGVTQDYIAVTDRYIRFTNKLANMLEERFPNRDLYAYQFAYGPGRPPPIEAMPADNVIIGYVGHFPLTSEHERAREQEDWRQWAEKAPMLVIRPNMFWYSGGWHGLPTLAVRHAVRDFRFLAEHNCVGINIDTAPQHWATQGPLYYAMAQLAWDPFQDGQALMDDYYRRGFGPAAQAIAEYFDLMESAHDRVTGHQGFRTSMGYVRPGVAVLADIYGDSELLREAETLLAKARAEVADGPEIYRRRVEFVRTGLEFTRVQTEIMRQMAQVRETKGADRGAVEKAIELCEAREQLFERHGGHALHWRDFTITWKRARSLEDYLGPPSEEFRKAAGLE